MSYDVYGRPELDDTTPGFQCFGFGGGLWDAETALLHFGSREYMPRVGRWIRKDPIGFDSGDANLYAYVSNDPVNAVDPSGLVAEPGFWEGLIPVWGAGRQALHDYECGEWGWAAFNGAVAVSDVFLVRSVAGGLMKGAWKYGGHSWSASRAWLSNHGWKSGVGYEYHHWFIPQGGWGASVPNAVKNQPWNIMSMNPALHSAIHYDMSLGQRLWFGTPAGLKAGAASLTGHVAGGSGGPCGCK